MNRGMIKLSVDQPDEPEPPDPLVEPNDMVAVASPCHPWEPIKVTEDWQESIHCLVCGTEFRV